MSTCRLSIVAPAYNEEECIVATVRSWADQLRSAGINNYEFVICDDGSKDMTVSLLRDMRDKGFPIEIITNSVNQGAGSSLYRAIKNSSGDAVILADSDGQFNISDVLPGLGEIELGMTDAIVGERKKNDRLLIRIGSRMTSTLLRRRFDSSVRDYNCALKMVRGEVIRTLPLRAKGLNYSAEVLVRLMQSNCKIRFIRVNHLDRQGGRSSAKLFRDGLRRITFTAFLLLEDRLIRHGVISFREVGR